MQELFFAFGFHDMIFLFHSRISQSKEYFNNVQKHGKSAFAKLLWKEIAYSNLNTVRCSCWKAILLSANRNMDMIRKLAENKIPIGKTKIYTTKTRATAIRRRNCNSRSHTKRLILLPSLPPPLNTIYHNHL